MKLEVQSGHCSGCRLCLQVCAIAHYKEINPKKAALRVVAHFPEPGFFEPIICDQCGDCAEVCPVEAITMVDGHWYLDPEECTECGICVDECPYDVLLLHRESDIPIKCDNCLECTKVCNTGALIAAE